MQHTFQIKTSELGESFLQSVRSFFGSREVKITVEDVASQDNKSRNADLARFVEHRKKHPAVKISDHRDFNEVISDLNE